MPGASYLQTSFLGGIWSKRMQGRSDRPDYRTAMNVCQNGISIEQGTWTRRPSTRLIAPSFLGRQARLIPIQFKENSPYTMEVTQSFARMIVGPRFAITNDAQTVVSILAGNPAQVTTNTAHGWTSIDQIQFPNLGNTCLALQGRRFFITVTGTTTFTLTDELTGAGIDGSALGPIPAGLIVQRILRIGVPYVTSDLPNLRAVQAETTTVLLNGLNLPQNITATKLPTATTDATFTSTAQFLSDGPYLDPIVNTTMTPSAASGTITLTQNGGPLVNNGAGFVAADVGRLVRLFSEPIPWPGSGSGTAGNIVSFGGGYWIQQVTATTTPPGSIGPLSAPIQGVNLGTAANIAGISAATTSTPQWLPLTVGAAAGWRWCTIASVVSTSAITVNNLSAPLVAVTPINTWRLGAYGGANGYPTCGTYRDGRLWLAGAINNRVDASNSNDIFNFAPTLTDGTVLDSNAIAATFNSDGVNPVFWLEPDLQGIIAGTQAGEYLIQPASNSSPLAPSNIQVNRVTKIRCANIEPRRTEHTTVFVQTFGRKIVEYFSDVYSGKFTAPDLTDHAKFLTYPGLAEIAYQQELIPIIWVRRTDGILLGATYKRDTLTTAQGPTFCGWHQHALGHGRTVESMCVGGSTGGLLETLFLSTVDPNSGYRYIEVMNDLIEEGQPVSAYWLLDGALVPTSSSRQFVNNLDSQVYYGLTIQNGMSVSLSVGGLDCGDYVVANGSISVPFGDGISAGTGSGLFTPDFAAANQAMVGSTYTSQGQLLRAIAPAESGARNGPALGKVRRTHKAAVLFADSAGVSIGTDFSKLHPCNFKSKGGTVDLTPLQLFSGIYKTTLEDKGSGFDSRLTWQITRPLPCTIAAYEGFLETQDE